ncbi:MAG: sucrase ferredoxin [Anaerolineales bacterium]|nr:sucrase ferredoxin [Anaerolineales bacterium]MCB9127163.1 sucrase ferredoxin [Ardenticatenales bacterium]MCB9171923.1 sucrase ferredoxin [Ardenticatenales bacterium]
MAELNGRDDGLVADDLIGSVKPYALHLALCTGGPRELWAARVEEMAGIFTALHGALQAHGLEGTVKLTACDDLSLSEEGVDLLLMPHMLRLPAITEARIESLMKALTTDFARGFPFDVAPMGGGDHLFLCVHQARDARCGQWGEAVAQAFEREIASQAAIATLHRSSHLGGHKYAATGILYPQGLWFGNLRPDDVPRFVAEQLNEEQLLPEFYRGRLGYSFAAQRVEGHAARHFQRRYGRFERLAVRVTEAADGERAQGQATASVATDEGWQARTVTVTLSWRAGRWHLLTISEEG